MVTQEFRESVEKGCGGVVILAGSDSDGKQIDAIVSSLEAYRIPYEVRIASGHKQSQKLVAILREYDGLKGPLGYVATASGTDAISGTASWESERIVISCPPDHTSDCPNMSCLTNPPGSSNAYIGDPRNIGKFFAQMFSFANPTYATRIVNARGGKVAKLETADAEFQRKYADRQSAAAGEKKE